MKSFLHYLIEQANQRLNLKPIRTYLENNINEISKYCSNIKLRSGKLKTGELFAAIFGTEDNEIEANIKALVELDSFKNFIKNFIFNSNDIQLIIETGKLEKVSKISGMYKSVQLIIKDEKNKIINDEYYITNISTFTGHVTKNSLQPSKIVATKDELTNEELFNNLSAGLKRAFNIPDNYDTSPEKIVNLSYEYLTACINSIQKINKTAKLGTKDSAKNVTINIIDNNDNPINIELKPDDYKEFEITFGECCVGLLLSKFKDMQVAFPGGNEPLIDVIGIENGIKYKISCKSGASRTVHAPSFKPILKYINELVKNNKVKLTDREQFFIKTLLEYDDNISQKLINKNLPSKTNVVKFKYFIPTLKKQLSKLHEAGDGPYQKQYEKYKKFINYLNDNWTDVLNSIMSKYLDNHYQCYVTFEKQQIIFKFIKMNSHNTKYSWQFSIGDTSSQDRGFKSHWLQIELAQK
jgi:hypothetical protein